MITVKSNIKQFLENYRKKVENFKVVLDSVAEKLAQKMIEFMKNEIEVNRLQWAEKGSLENISSVDFTITPLSEKAVRISIGDNLPKYQMNDGTFVNPAFFIEFGFGITGQNNPKHNHEYFDWEYNINGHTYAWWYMGLDGQFYETEGVQGVNFMYNAQQKAKEFLNEILKEQANG